MITWYQEIGQVKQVNENLVTITGKEKNNLFQSKTELFEEN